ncbi:MAG: ankyrin repeat domain-containing protein [Alphaproteobacteria bacterium]|nr:ankyrin repeat domain-containing protein [Alphaproteobacteria bacterium]
MRSLPRFSLQGIVIAPRARACVKLSAAALVALAVLAPPEAAGQLAPSADEVAAYQGPHAAAPGVAVDARDGNGRTPLMIAGHRGHHGAARALLDAGADPNARDRQRYDLVTIAAVRGDAEMVRLALERGASARNVTSPYDGTALIAAAHLGHVGPVRALILAGAPLDHVNNLKWTALIEAIVLGDGGPRHTEVVRLLVGAGAAVNLADGDGLTPLALAERRGHADMVRILEVAGARR